MLVYDTRKCMILKTTAFHSTKHKRFRIFFNVMQNTENSAAVFFFLLRDLREKQGLS